MVIKYVLYFFPQLLFKTFLSTKSIHSRSRINIIRATSKVYLAAVRFHLNLKCVDTI